MNTQKLQDIEVAYHSYGTPSNDKAPIILLHGFPDDASAWKAAAEQLAEAGHYALAPYVRGCGPTRFLNNDVPRSGSPAARVRDVIEFMDALHIDKAVIVGQDWGATTAQALCMLYPERVERLVLLNGQGLLNMQVFSQGKIPTWQTFHAGWYQWLFLQPLAKQLLESDREGFARYAWQQWSPGWNFSEGEFAAASESFKNPNWVEVVLSAYQMDASTADPRDTEVMAKLSSPTVAITRPTLHLQGVNDGVDLYVDTQLGQEEFYKDMYISKQLEGCGHFLQREQPQLVADEIMAFLES